MFKWSSFHLPQEPISYTIGLGSVWVHWLIRFNISTEEQRIFIRLIFETFLHLIGTILCVCVRVRVWRQQQQQHNQSAKSVMRHNTVCTCQQPLTYPIQDLGSYLNDTALWEKPGRLGVKKHKQHITLF